MLKKKHMLVLAFFQLAGIAQVHAGYAQDSGKIVELYANDQGSIAIRLDGGFPNSVSSSQCPTSNGWAGNGTANNSLKAALMTAKATGSNVLLTTQGCDAGGAWLKVVDIYVR
jgi:hypothetical protein